MHSWHLLKLSTELWLSVKSLHLQLIGFKWCVQSLGDSPEPERLGCTTKRNVFGWPARVHSSAFAKCQLFLECTCKTVHTSNGTLRVFHLNAFPLQVKNSSRLLCRPISASVLNRPEVRTNEVSLCGITLKEMSPGASEQAAYDVEGAHGHWSVY